MKANHAAAIVLGVWYLMMAPPLPGTHSNTQSAAADTKARLSRWTIVGIFPAQKECEASRHANPGQRCLAADDPRFRENNPPP
jgi:hypothetical protein